MSSYYGTGSQQNQRQRRNQQSGQQTPQQQPGQLPTLNVNTGNQQQQGQGAPPPQLAPTLGQKPGQLPTLNVNSGNQAASGQQILMGQPGSGLYRAPPPEQSPGQQMWEEAQESFGQTMQAHENSWGDVQQGLQAQQSQDSRRAAEANAAMGGGLGGAFQGGMAQASMNTATRMADARHQHNLRGLELRMTMLQNQIQRAQQLDDMDLTRELQAEADKTAMAIAKMNSQVQLTGMGMQMNENGEIVPGGVGGGDGNAPEGQGGTGAQTSPEATLQSNTILTEIEDALQMGVGTTMTQDDVQEWVTAADRYMTDYYARTGEWPSKQMVNDHLQKLVNQGHLGSHGPNAP